MDFLLINTAKLKVTISEDELRERGIDIQAADYDESCLGSTLTEIFALARDSCGFKLGKERVLVQLYPLGKGAELFITKLSILPANERRVISEADGLNTYSRRQAFFRFEGLNDLICAARATAGRSCASDVYKAPDGSYYIRIIEEGLDRLTISDTLLEYGSRIGALPLGIEGEYGSLLIKGEGLNLLAKM